LKASPNNVVIAPGCKIALFMAMMALIDPATKFCIQIQVFPGIPP